MSNYEKAVKLWQSHTFDKPSDLDNVLEHFSVLFAYHSGKIENDKITYHDTREIFHGGKVTGYTGETKALFEQQNQKLCYELLKDKIVNKEPITVSLVLEIHRVLTSGTYDERRYIENGERPGEFKKHDYVTGLLEVGSPAEDVESDLSELIAEITDYNGSQLIKATAYFHARFEGIHPFADGNGRVGRTLLNYFLMINNHPPLIVYDEDKRMYYECLAAYDEKEDIGPLGEFFTYETEKTWQKTLRLSEETPHKTLDDFTQSL